MSCSSPMVFSMVGAMNWRRWEAESFSMIW